MSKRPSPDQPTTANLKRRKASGFRLARSGPTDSAQSTSSSSSRFVTLSENPDGRGSLRARNRLLHGNSEPSSISKNQSNDAEPQVSDATLGLQEPAYDEGVQPDTTHTEHTQEERKRNRHTKTCVSALSIFLHV
jgi:hypothetical protein